MTYENSISLSRTNPGWCENIGLTYAGGTLTVCSAYGAAFSARNKGTVVLRSKANPGLAKRYFVTANQSCTDGIAGQTATADFGISPLNNLGTATQPWNLDFPLYIYAVGNDAEDTIAFMLCRVPHLTTSPAAAGISKAGAIINVNQHDMFCMANVAVADYDGNPCVCIGSVRARTTINAAHNNITIQALDNTDGIGAYHEETLFLMPTGVNLAMSGYYFVAYNGGPFVWQCDYIHVSRPRAEQRTQLYVCEPDLLGASISWRHEDDPCGYTNLYRVVAICPGHALSAI